MEEILLRRAGAEDAELLTQLRKVVLIAANRLPEDADLSVLEEPCRVYFADTRRQTTYLALCGGEIAGVGSVDYHTELPTVSNPTGECAFLMNIYTAPAHRRRGVARRIVEKLIEDVKARGIRSVLLEATEMGKPLYENLGFENAQGYMRLKLR